MINLYVNNEKILSIFIFSMIFVTFTQLRLFTLPIGLGELGLLFLGLLSFIRIYKLNKIEVMKYSYSSLFVKFWLVSFLLLILAYVWVHVTKIHHSNTNVFHDILAYGFIFYIVLLFIIIDEYLKINFEIIMSKMLYYTVVLYAILLTVTLVLGDDLGITKHWPGMVRFIGLSSNPNQVALVFIVIPFILMYFYKNNNISFDKEYIPYLILLSLIIVYLIHSRGLILAWSVSAVFIVYYQLYSFSSKYIKIILHLTLLLLLFLLLTFASNFNELMLELFSKGTGGFTHRMELWSNALELIKNSFLVGFGPGAHVNSVVNTSHYWEVHNTFIDFTLQTGIIGLLLYLFLLYKIGKKLMETKNIYLMGAFVALIVFSTFHFVFRQPIFWFYLFYFYQMGREKKCAE